MNVDDVVTSLKETPRPELSPFFATRVMQRSRHFKRHRSASWVLSLYWILFSAFAATLIIPTRFGLPIAIIVVAIAVFADRIAPFAAALVASEDAR